MLFGLENIASSEPLRLFCSRRQSKDVVGSVARTAQDSSVNVVSRINMEILKVRFSHSALVFSRNTFAFASALHLVRSLHTSGRYAVREYSENLGCTHRVKRGASNINDRDVLWSDTVPRTRRIQRISSFVRTITIGRVCKGSSCSYGGSRVWRAVPWCQWRSEIVFAKLKTIERVCVKIDIVQ